jgi:CRISPR-associated protein Cmr3
MTGDQLSKVGFIYARTPNFYSPLRAALWQCWPFLSPENLVGRSGTSFPPSAATFSGLFAAAYGNDAIQGLQVAGPFWAWSHNPQNFYVPTPFNCLVKNKVIRQRMAHKQEQWQVWSEEDQQWQTPPNDKFEKGTWLAIDDWKQIASSEQDRSRSAPGTASPLPQVQTAPWQSLPHLHPRLRTDERRVDQDQERGSLFLENGVQLHPDACLVYLANMKLPPRWYRFGGEGHMVDVQCDPIAPSVCTLLAQPLGHSFALITPAIWGSNRLSYREPKVLLNNQWCSVWKNPSLLTERPTPFRYRMGGKGKTKRLSRGRYAVVPGTVYVTENAVPAWQDWPEDWFPREGPSLKRWGCGLALPLPIARVDRPDESIAQPISNLQNLA